MMNRKKKKELRQRQSTRQLMGILKITPHGIQTKHAHIRSTNSQGKTFRINIEGSESIHSFHKNGTDKSLYGNTAQKRCGIKVSVVKYRHG